MGLVEAKELVDAWSAAWPGGTSVAVASALDELVGDALEEEGARPGGPLVTMDGGVARVDAQAIARWTLGWPARHGMAGKLLREGAVRWRLEQLEEHAPARAAAWRAVLASLPEIRWAELPPMEVVSLAMGHYGPARQQAAGPVIHSALIAIAGAFAASTPGREGLAKAAARAVTAYEPSFAQIAATSARAIEELARRAGEPDPFAIPIRGYLPRLGGRLV